MTQGRRVSEAVVLEITASQRPCVNPHRDDSSHFIFSPFFVSFGNRFLSFREIRVHPCKSVSKSLSLPPTLRPKTDWAMIVGSVDGGVLSMGFSDGFDFA